MASELVPELTNGKFDEFIKKGIVVVDFFAEWCMPCLMMSPIVDELAEKFKGKIKFGKVNVEDAPEIASKFEVSSIPNIFILKNGEIVESFLGAKSSEDFEEVLGKYL